MYSEWVSIPASIKAEENRWSVLNKFPANTGRDVVVAVVRPLAASLGISTSSCQPSNLKSEKDVDWCMEVICFGLGLPLSENEAIRDCVNVYCEWLSALTKAKACVPKPVTEDPNAYARKMIQHLYNLFLPRSENNSDIISRQAVLCHRVLRTIETLAQESQTLQRKTWDAILLFLLAINDTLLSPPSVHDDISSKLGERILSVLFKVWLLACHRCFPTPPLWKTFRELCCSWRHRQALVDQWNKVNLALTSRLLQIMYGQNLPPVKIAESDQQLVPSDMSDENVAQSWFRFLHTLSNPVDLCRPQIISQTPKFYDFALTSESVIDPCQHPCLKSLPLIFHKAMHGLATLVNAFMGIHIAEVEEVTATTKTQGKPTVQSITPPHQRRNVAKSVVGTKGGQRTGLMAGLTSRTSSVVSSSVIPTQPPPQAQSISQSTVSLSVQAPGSPSSSATTPTGTAPSSPQPLSHPTGPSSSRPNVNSVLHLFGTWLFEAALIGTGLMVPSPPEVDSSRRPSSLVLDSSLSTVGSSMSSGMPDTIEIPLNLSVENFEAGQAEALGVLCRLVCSKRSSEEILPAYLARFYLALHHGLSGGKDALGQVLSSILVNSVDLFRQDLDGILVLLPPFISALELVLPERDLKLNPQPNISQVELRRAAIQLLLSMLPLPLHFKDLVIQELPGTALTEIQVSSQQQNQNRKLTLQSLRPRLMNLLINALQAELDSANTQMLLGGLLECVQDSAAVEEVEQFTQQAGGTGMDSRSESVATLLVSGSEAASASGSGPPSLTPSLASSDGGSFQSADWTEMPDMTATDSAYALFVRATYLICHRLISSWKTDLNVSLAALEALSGLAKIHLPQQDSQECKRAVKWICDYIVYQCSRPPPAHSKDLHSTIVAAYHCVTTWLLEHPNLLKDKDSIYTVLEVVELGISGSKSQGKSGEMPQMKASKELKPASLRVKDAAEGVLTAMMEHVGYFPPPSGSETLSSLLEEEWLLHYSNTWTGPITKEQAISHFRYFVIDNSFILALLEQHLGNDQDPQPTVTALIRGPFGRHAWAMQQRHLPRYKSGCSKSSHSGSLKKPKPVATPSNQHHVKHKYFPDSVSRIPFCEADTSIPSLESIFAEVSCHDQMKQLVQHVSQSENASLQGTGNTGSTSDGCPVESPPELCQEYQTARLILSHLGFLSLESLKGSLIQPLPSLTTLNASSGGYSSQLEQLDGIPSRTHDTIFAFYVKRNQKDASAILGNMSGLNGTPAPREFVEFLLSMGWPVDVAKHCGWTGHVSTAWKSASPKAQAVAAANNAALGYDGLQQVLYWSDATSEVAIVVPSGRSITESDKKDKPVDQDGVTLRSKVRFEVPHKDPLESSMEEMLEGPRMNGKPRSLSLNLDEGGHPVLLHQGQGRSSGRKFGRGSSTQCEPKVLAVWLESYEDGLTFPLSDLLPETLTGQEPSIFPPHSLEKDVFVIFIHSLKSGLFRIRVQMPSAPQHHSSRMCALALPLMDGMVVSRRVLGPMVKQTALNLCRRRRLDTESCVPPHVRRRHKIQDIVEQYKCQMSEAEFFTSLFIPTPNPEVSV